MKLLALAVIITAALSFTACSPQAAHPNQLSTFDGDSYDALTASHGALLGLRTEAVALPQYKDAFNQAATSYNTALQAYTLFRSAPSQNQLQVSLEISSLTQGIVALENAFQVGMNVTPAQKAAATAQVTKKARSISRATSNVSLTTILTDLQIAASVAEVIPGASPYAALAQVVIAGTEQAISAVQAASGQPIDLSTISAIALI